VEIRGFDTSNGEQVLAYPNGSVRIVNGVASYLHRDGLMSVRAVTGTDGAADEKAVYRPFGEQQEWVLDASAAGEDKGFIGERYDADGARLKKIKSRERRWRRSSPTRTPRCAWSTARPPSCTTMCRPRFGRRPGNA
jgi:hypothetical protein